MNILSLCSRENEENKKDLEDQRTIITSKETFSKIKF